MGQSVNAESGSRKKAVKQRCLMTRGWRERQKEKYDFQAFLQDLLRRTFGLLFKERSYPEQPVSPLHSWVPKAQRGKLLKLVEPGGTTQCPHSSMTA